MKRIRQIIFTAFLILSCHFSNMAQLPVEHTELFSIAMGSDTVDFIKISKDNSDSVKPVLIYITGSQPIPLIIVDDKGPFISCVGSFDHMELSRRYHIVLISKPYTPVIENLDRLNPSGAYVPDVLKPNLFDERYLERNHLGYYVEQTKAVIDFLKQQPWVQRDKIVLMGHSQGAHVAAHVAMDVPGLYALGYFGGNVMGRFSEMINRQMNAEKEGKISAAEAQNRIDDLYQFWIEVCRGEDEIPYTDPPKTWRSFSRQYIDEFTAIEVPVFIAYGSEDPGAQQCAMLPIYLELAGKTDYKIRPFTGCDHDFEETLPDGGKKWRWQNLMDEFIGWCDKLNDN